MRILVFNWRDLAHPRAGGAEVYTDAVATEWERMGHEVVLFTSAVEGAPAEETAAGGYRIIRRGGRHGVYREARRYWEREAAGKFDLVIDEVNTRPFGCPRWVRDTPVLGLIHQVCREVWFYEASLPVALLGRYLLEPAWLRQFRSVPVVTVSESSRESLKLYGITKVTVVPEGHIAPAASARVNLAAYPVILYLGRLTRNKRPDHVLKAFGIVKQKLPDAELWFVGDGPMRAKMERARQDGVRFFGRVSSAERERLLSQANCIAVTSVREGWGLVVTEAATVGTPAVAYDVPGLRDSVLASGGVLVAQGPIVLGEALVTNLLRWKQEPAVVSSGGVLEWKEVAKKLLAVIAQPSDSNEILGRVGRRKSDSQATPQRRSRQSPVASYREGDIQEDNTKA